MEFRIADTFTDSIFDDRIRTVSGHVSLSTMHLVKGLEFRAVAVMACDDEVVPCRSGSRRWGMMRT